MKLLKKHLLPDECMEAKVEISTTEDLWQLYNMVVPGDCLETVTKRKVTNENIVGSSRTQVRTLHLKIEIKDVNFSPDELRVHGVNKTQNEFVKLGAFHTLTVVCDPRQTVTIFKKDWDEIAEARLQEACNVEGAADTAAVLMNFGEASVILVTPSVLFTKAKVGVSIAKKHKNDASARDKSINKFFKQVLEAIISHIDLDKIKVVLICSPGHVREEFFAYLKREAMKSDIPSLHALQKNLSSFILVRVNSCTHNGLREAFSDPVVSTKMNCTRCVSDIRVWEKFQTTMNKNPDLCVYTPQCVFEAARHDSLSALMISDVVFRSSDPIERKFYLALVNYAKQHGGCTVNVFSSNHVTGEQLSQLGNIAAILQFECPDLDDLEIDENFLQTNEVMTFIRDNTKNSVAQ